MKSVIFRPIIYRNLFALVLVALLTFSVSGAAAAFKNIKVGDQALPIKLDDLKGQEHSLAKYRDFKAVILFFWATWSERSLKELSDLEKLQAQYSDKGLQILAINVENQKISEEELGHIRTILEENEISYPVLIDHGLKAYSEWGVIATPTTAIIGSDGIVSFDLSSYPSSAYLDLEQAILKSLGLYVEEEKIKEAEPSYVPVREALLHLGLGKRHAQKGFMTKALPEFEKAAVADSGWAEPPMYMGYAYYRMGDMVKADASLTQASRLDPDRKETKWLRGYLLAGQEKVDEALALLQSDKSAIAPGEKLDNKEVDAVSGDSDRAGIDTPPAEVRQPEPGVADDLLDLSEVVALTEAGETAKAAKALEDILGKRLDDAGFTMKKKKKISAMEKMKLMMQKNQGQ